MAMEATATMAMERGLLLLNLDMDMVTMDMVTMGTEAMDTMDMEREQLKQNLDTDMAMDMVTMDMEAMVMDTAITDTMGNIYRHSFIPNMLLLFMKLISSHSSHE